ncbi:transcriptional regulator, HxlR family [Quadrisphaera granulorum]|uniref:HxlR family transcriptional regulator n=1 Tax=Quadrisphaera granulorum TaxID=317664 RepID=A0A316A814_9ACTN|nr:helix-turn-helix domain-containing protein [Quadrisphaera granulorum]PWJ53632.1 HxlR family transcriptional regulator [Quadrisphaera granulorum]SZE96676.1 transcriptional regulator, HxlR family [Quadrisphaera granulorum]
MVTMTAAQRRAQEKAEYDAYLASCPSRILLDRLTDKWVVLVLSALADGPARNAQLARRIAGVSPKMLSQTLRSLERDGLITRTVEATVPVTVTYELTDLGRSLMEVIRPLKGWAERHVPQVLAARETHDAD